MLEQKMTWAQNPARLGPLVSLYRRHHFYFSSSFSFCFSFSSFLQVIPLHPPRSELLDPQPIPHQDLLAKALMILNLGRLSSLMLRPYLPDSELAFNSDQLDSQALKPAQPIQGLVQMILRLLWLSVSVPCSPQLSNLSLRVMAECPWFLQLMSLLSAFLLHHRFVGFLVQTAYPLNGSVRLPS